MIDLYLLKNYYQSSPFLELSQLAAHKVYNNEDIPAGSFL